MSRQLIESIVSNNMLEANDMVEAKLAEIRDRKIHEMKRMYAARMDEVLGGITPAQMKADLASGKKKRAIDVLGLSPYDKAQEAKKKREKEYDKKPAPKAEKKSWFPKIDMSKEKKIGEETLDEAGLGYGAKVARDPYMTPAKKKMFMAIRKFDKKARLVAKGKSEQPKDSEAPEVKAPKSKKNKSKDVEYQRPGMIKRNVNTLMGREPGYVDDRKPEEKMYSKGGRAGKVARFVARDIVGRGVGSVVSDLANIGSSKL